MKQRAQRFGEASTPKIAFVEHTCIHAAIWVDFIPRSKVVEREAIEKRKAKFGAIDTDAEAKAKREKRFGAQ